MSTDSNIYFKVTAYAPDWPEGALLKSFVQSMSELGLVGPGAWHEGVDEPRKKKKYALSNEVLDQLIEHHTDSDGRTEFTMGGERENGRWRIFWFTPRMDKEHGKMGINTMWMLASLPTDDCVSLSPKLVDAFYATVSPENAEHACIHIYDHWHTLSLGAYEAPLTIGPMFNGVHWCNFIGGSEFKKFDVERLSELGLTETSELREDSFYFVVGSDIIAAASIDGEAELVSVTAKFRDALKSSVT